MTVANKTCAIQTATTKKIACLITKGSLSNSSVYVGNSGFKELEFNLTLSDYDSLRNLDNLRAYVNSGLSSPVYNNSDLIFRQRTTLEIQLIPYEDAGHADGPLTHHAKSFQGWFKAPATGEHIFYVSCDDEA